jgi:transglutaminase-like putative cysteine protease
MAHPQGTTARTQRLIAVLATALLAASTAFAIGRVFQEHASTYRLLTAGLASAAIACALERKNLVLATLVSAVAMFVVVGLLVFPETTWYGLPTPEALRAVVDAAGLVGQQARYQVAPTEALPPLLLGAVTALWAAVFSAHALAFRAGSPLLALLPPVALLAFADTVLEDVIRPLYGVVFLVAAAIVIFADGLRRVQRWGPIWTPPGRDSRLSVAAGRGARRVAAATIAVAALSPLILPGFGSKAVIDFSTHGDDEVRINPIVSVQSSLQRDDPVDVFEVRTRTPMYWRMVALPDFDGAAWHPDLDAQTVETTPSASLTMNSVADPASLETETTTVSFHTLSDLALPWLPLPFPARSTDIETDDLRWDPESGSMVLPDALGRDTSYEAVAQIVRPTPDQLRAEDVAVAPDSDRYTTVPDDLPPAIGQLAKTWTEGATTDYDRIVALQDTFTSPTAGFSYNKDVDLAEDPDALLRFLTDSQEGFCQQYSSAMAIMLRTLGIPARVAIGFTAGSFDDSADVRRVTTDDAHAWVEVRFPDFGWLTFEPTPTRNGPAISAYPYIDPTVAQPCQANPGASCLPTGGRGGPGGGVGGPRFDGKTGLTADAQRPGGQNGDLGIPVTADIAVPEGRRVTVRQAALAGILLVVVALLLVPPVRAWRRRRRLRSAAGEPRTLILATYDVFTERASELGFPRERGQTLEEYRARVASSGALADGDLDRLTRITADAAYAPREPDAAQAREATRAAETVLRGLRRATPLGQRLSGLYLRR